MSFVKKFLIIICILFLSACQQKESPNQIRVGVVAGPEAQLMEVAKQVAAKKYHLTIQIVQFDDYNMPNEALADGDIDANMFQHLPYLQAAIVAKGYKIVPIGRTFVYPMALYSKKVKELSQLQNHAIIAIPNDPSNEARALLLLQKGGLITLKQYGIIIAMTDINKNPKNLQLKEIDAAQLPRVLSDVDAAVINTNYAMEAGLKPSKDGLIVEDKSSPYANLVVVRATDKNNPKLLELVDSLHSPEVLAAAQTLFQGEAIPAWK